MLNLFNFLDFIYLIFIYFIFLNKINKNYSYFNLYYTIFIIYFLYYILELFHQYTYLFNTIYENFFHINIWEQLLFRLSIFWTSNENIYVLWWIFILFYIIIFINYNYKYNNLFTTIIQLNNKFFYFFIIIGYSFIYIYKNSIIYNIINLNTTFNYLNIKIIKKILIF